MTTKEIEVFTSRKHGAGGGDERTPKKSTQNDRNKQRQNARLNATPTNSKTPQFPEPFFADDPEYMKGFRALLGEFRLKYETFNLNFLVERIKHLKRRENSIMLFNERLKQDLALIVNTSPAPGTTTLDPQRDHMQQQQQTQTSSGLNTSGDNSNRVSSRLRSRTMGAIHDEMPSNTSSSFSTTTITSPSNISFSYNLRSHSSLSLSSTSVSSSSKIKNKKNNYNTSSSSSLLIRTLKHSFINSLNNQK
jgi:hypothetical protein